MSAKTTDWDKVYRTARGYVLSRVFRVMKKEAYLSVINEWIPGKGNLLLKVDCHEEARDLGSFLKECHDRFSKVVLLDISLTTVKDAVRRTGKETGTFWLCTDVRMLPFKNELYDVVIAPGTLSYTDVEVGLKEIFRVLKPGGILITSVLNSDNILYAFAKFSKDFVLSMTHGYQRQTFEQILKKMEFIEIESRYIFATMPLWNRPALFLEKIKMAEFFEKCVMTGSRLLKKNGWLEKHFSWLVVCKAVKPKCNKNIF